MTTTHRPATAKDAATQTIPTSDTAAAKRQLRINVGRLRLGQVVSMPECGVAPSFISAISQPFHGMRVIELTDPDTGDIRPARLWLGLDRIMTVHPATVSHHTYTNISDQDLAVRLGH